MVETIVFPDDWRNKFFRNIDIFLVHDLACNAERQDVSQFEAVFNDSVSRVTAGAEKKKCVHCPHLYSGSVGFQYLPRHQLWWLKIYRDIPQFFQENTGLSSRMGPQSLLPNPSQFAEAEPCNSKCLMPNHTTECDPVVSFVHYGRVYLPKRRCHFEDNRFMTRDAV